MNIITENGDKQSYSVKLDIETAKYSIDFKFIDGGRVQKTFEYGTTLKDVQYFINNLIHNS